MGGFLLYELCFAVSERCLIQRGDAGEDALGDGDVGVVDRAILEDIGGKEGNGVVGRIQQTGGKVLHHGFLWDSKFRSSLFKGLRIPKAVPLVADRSRRNPKNRKAQEGSQNSPVDCFGVGNPRRGFPDAKHRSHNFS